MRDQPQPEGSICEDASARGMQAHPRKAVLCGAVLSHSVVSDSLRPHGLQPARLLCPWNVPGKNSEVGCHFFPQGIFPTQGLNLQSRVSCIVRQVLYHWTTWEALGWWWFGREAQEGEDICMWIAGSLCCAAELTQHCKAIILNKKLSEKLTVNKKWRDCFRWKAIKQT